MNNERGPWTAEKLHELLGQFEEELREAGLAATSIRTYVDRSTYFVRWLAGDNQPRQHG
jgi:hypothetical protein